MVKSAPFIFFLLISTLWSSVGVLQSGYSEMSLVWRKFLKLSSATTVSILISSQLTATIADSSDSKLLTTTVRSNYEYESTAKQSLFDTWKSNFPHLSLPTGISIDSVDLNTFPQSTVQFLNSLPSSYGLAISLIVFVLWIEAANSAGDYKNLYDEKLIDISNLNEQIKNIQLLLDKESDKQGKGLDVSAIEVSLRKQVDDLLKQISLQDKHIGDLSSSLSKISEELKRNKPIPIAQPQPFVDNKPSDEESKKLWSKIRELESDKSSLVARDKVVLESLKRFLVTTGFLPQGVANMLLWSNLGDTLHALMDKQRPSVVAEELAAATTTVIEGLREEVREKTQQLVQERSRNDQLQASSTSSLSRIKEVEAQLKTVSDQYQQLLQEKNTPPPPPVPVEDNEWRSRLDAAKTMTQELNSKLMDKQKQLDQQEKKSE